MVSTFHGIETAKRSLNTQTAALNTTGHNISNANTAGYSRQVVSMKASESMEAYGLNRSVVRGQMGTGVEFTAIERVRQTFLDDQYRNENTSYGGWNVRYDTLNKLQTIMNEPSDTGIRKVMDNFWDAWSDFSQDPQDITNRKIVKETTLALTDALNQTSKQLDALSSDLTNNITLKTTEMNSLLQSIADLNGNIAKLESLGDNPNDLKDQRDYAVDQLSKLANVQVTQLDNGYQVTVAGQVAVAGTEVTAVTGEGLVAAFQGGTLTGGEVYGMVMSRDRYVADYKSQLDQLANTLANGNISVKLPAGTVLPEGTVLNTGVNGAAVTYSNANNNRTLTSDLTVTVKGINGLHQLGYTMSGTTAQTGGAFFTSTDGAVITAGNITLNPDIQNDPEKIASSLRVNGAGTTNEQVTVGNNGLALLMSGLKANKFEFSGATAKNTTVDDFFSSIVGQLGVQTQEAERQSENAQLLTEQVDLNRQSVSGVSLDEEMSNMIKFQHAYSASSRFMTTFDQLLDKLINSTGRVGL
ncbi:flagellar hook-associated protein FlgK [Paenibacillus sp. P2(2022)]|uniref:flagellar hook-associated protein FlgK n=1 Tax=Paenibacillus TaxID=44249 RepID=UPI0005ECE220|nr:MULTISPECIES: flagellar hook-associated protein FlgK [Paenibacillus]AUS28892.1 flagellar hook-associated protein FlgK [Paenibacillus polymyxa]KJK29955.1 flagellar hook protein FlgK [Paenibacillus polymyxa]MDG0054448.1 flagellar hook-associated protein FlgK [Paenibacillus sp. P2(2022)]